MSARTSALRAAREACGWSQTEAARALAELARARGIRIASPRSLKTQLSRWENGHAAPEAPYRALLGELFAGSGVNLAPTEQEPATGPAERLRARLASAAAVDAEVIALWRAQLATAQQLDDRLGAAGAAAAVDALLTQLDGLLPLLPDAARHRPVAVLLARAFLLGGAQALDGGDPDAASVRFGRAGVIARSVAAADLAEQAAIGQAEALLEVDAAHEALAVLEHAGADLSHPPPGLPVELTASMAAHPTHAGHTVEHLAAALERGPGSARERATLHADLARALHAAGREAEAAPHAREARALAARIGSRRVLRRLDDHVSAAGRGLSAGSAVSSSASAAR